MAVIEVLAGGAASGKTTRLLEIYRTALREALDRGEPGTAVWLTPSHHSARDVQQRLVGERHASAFQPNVLRFDEFARRILARTARPVARLTPAMRRALLRRIVSRQLHQKTLTYFAAIAHTSGFLELLSNFISELKRAEIWPEQYLEVCGRQSVRDRELAALYDEYQQVLLARNLYDAEGQFWFAREAIHAGNWIPFQNLRLVVVDGFTDFLHTQYEILAALAGRAERVLVSLPLEEGDRRADLFAKTRDVLKRLQSLGDVRLLPAAKEAAADSLPPGVRQIADHLFCNPRLPLPPADTSGVEIHAAAGENNERRLLAARVKGLLTEGVPASEIAIVLRNIQDADLLVEQLVAAGIPVSCEAGQPLDRTPAMRSLMSALRIETDDWAFERLMAFLDSSAFRPKWPGIAVKQSARDVARELRRLRLPFGREVILEALGSERESQERRRSEARAPNPESQISDLESQTAPPPPGDDGLADRLAAVGRAVELLQRVDDAFLPLRKPRTLPQWAGSIREFARELGFFSEPDPSSEGVDPDGVAWEAFERLLADVSKAERCLADDHQTLTLAEFVSELTDAVRHLALTKAGVPGGVRILEAEHVRNLDVPYLFVAGLKEDSFPKRRGEDCVLHDRERRELRARGLDLRDDRHHQQDEMLLFHGVVTRARKQLVLTYPAVDAAGSPLPPSPYLVALRGILPTLTSGLEEPLNPVPRADRVLSAADVRVFAMQEARDGRPGLLASLFEQTESRPAVANALAAVDMAAARFHTQQFTAFEGRLENEANLRAIRERFGPEHQFSASQLENYAACPFKYLLGDVFHIQELPSPDIRDDLAARGSDVHAILTDLHGAVWDSLEDDDPLPSGEEIAQRFHELASRLLSRRPRRSGVQQSLADIESRQFQEYAEQYGRQWEAYRGLYQRWTNPPRPACFELQFGQPGGRSNPRQQEAREPLVVGTGPNAVRLGGYIDRVDIGRQDDKPVFIVIDYKTGKVKPMQAATVQKGKRLQLVLYSLAVQQLGLAGGGALPFSMGYWGLQANGFAPPMFRNKPIPPEGLQDLHRDLEAIVPRLAAGLRSAAFPVFNEEPHCTSHCSYRTVCRVSQTRAVAESLNKTWEPPAGA